MSSPNPNEPSPSEPSPHPAGLPPAPWILVDRVIVEQTASVFERLEQWLCGGNPTAARLCAQACSLSEADADEVAAWLGTLAAHLYQRLEISDAGTDTGCRGPGSGPISGPISDEDGLDRWP